MKVTIVAAIAIIATAAAGAASAQTTASLGYSSFKFDKAQFDAITGKVGWHSGWFGVEGELSAGVADANHFVGPNNVNMKMRDEAAIYATATYPLGDNMDVFGRVGYGTTRIKANLPTAGLIGTAESWNLGVGGEWFVHDKTGLRAEYTRETFNNSYSSDADVWSLSVVQKF
jgi:hypothetical protein